MDNEKRIRLLQFVTGTCRLPVGGFAELIGRVIISNITDPCVIQYSMKSLHAIKMPDGFIFHIYIYIYIILELSK